MSRTVDQKRFTKEFPGFEIESKWEFTRQPPEDFMPRVLNDLNAGVWTPYRVADRMGSLPTGLCCFELEFLFFGIRRQYTGAWRHVATAARIPGFDKYQLAFKGTAQPFPCQAVTMPHAPLLRKEKRTGDWTTRRRMLQTIHASEPHAEYCGSLRRKKTSVYITNSRTYRNFNVSVDVCHSRNETVCQLEIEYKGRNGIRTPDTRGLQILQEFITLHAIIERCYSANVRPTTRTKFEWIIGL